MTEHDPSSPPQSCCPKFRAWLQLMRIANLPTAIANVAAGAALTTLFSRGDLFTGGLFALAVCMSALLYTSGMILNDAFDAEVDAIERPHRPIPAGKISRSTAFRVGFSMMTIAVVAPLILMLVASFLDNDQQSNAALLGLSGTAFVLAVFIVLYDGPLKRTWLAPPIMGSCRTLNILLGTFTSNQLYSFDWYSSYHNEAWFVYSLTIGLFVTGITLLGRGESKQQQSRLWIGLGAIMMLIAFWVQATRIHLDSVISVRQAYWAMLALIAFPIVRRLIWAIQKANPAAVGAAIGTSLSNLVFLDAAVCFLVRPDQPIYAGAVAMLILPVMILRRFSTQT